MFGFGDDDFINDVLDDTGINFGEIIPLNDDLAVDINTGNIRIIPGLHTITQDGNVEGEED